MKQSDKTLFLEKEDGVFVFGRSAEDTNKGMSELVDKSFLPVFIFP